jgi:Tfp pilus assembly PilM family ATPase/Tfp pilus assembly protein PilN
MARIIGIDLGTWSVKMTVMRGGFGRFEVEENLYALVPQTDGSIPDIETRCTVIEELFSGLTVESNTLHGTGFPSQQASLRLVQMPFTDKNQIAQTLEFEVESLVPYDLEEMAIGHRIVGTTDQGSQVLAGLIPRTDLAPLLAAYQEVQADPKTLTIDGDIFGALGTSGVEAMIDIGHSRTLISVAKDGQTLFSRAIDLAGKHLTAAVAKELEISWAEAEQRKHGSRLSTNTVAEWDEDQETQTGTEEPPVQNSTKDTATILRSALSPLQASLRASLIAFEDASGLEVDRVWLTGGTSNLDGLSNLLKVDLGVPVANIQKGMDIHGEPNAHGLSHAYAMRTAGLAFSDSIEFRGGDFKFRGDLANLRMLARWAGVAAVAMVILAVGYFFSQMADANERMAALDTQIADVVATTFPEGEAPTDFDGPDDALMQLQLRTMETTARIDLLGKSVDPSPPTLTTLNNLSAALPDPATARIDVNELTITEKTISLQADTDGYDAASNIESSLQANEHFKRASKGEEKKVRDGIRFSIVIPLEDEAMEEG